MKHAIGNKALGTRKGTAIVEFAFVLPIFVLLLVGVVEFSRVLMVKQVITNAAREGARAGSIYFDDTQAVTNAANVSQNYLAACGIDTDTEPVTVTPSLLINNGSSALQVAISYNYDSLLTGWIPGLPETLGLSATAVMRREA